MGQVDEIGGVTDLCWESSACRRKDSGSQTEHCNGSRETEAEHEGGENRGVVCQQHRYGKYDGKSIGRPFESFEVFNQIHLSDTQECSKGKEIDCVGRETWNEGTDT